MKIGQDVETGKIIEIDDIPRQSGLYILGKPGMGKSNLIELSVLSDISDGVFFLDPHGDSIDKIVKHLKPSRYDKIMNFEIKFIMQPQDSYMDTSGYIIKEETPVRIIDPEDEEYSFGINPLSCNDLTSLKERTDTYTRAYNVFYKIWEEEWGVWLQLIVQNTLYVFLENPDYTLADVPLFFTNENFRRFLVNNVKYNLDVKDFWLTRFESKREYDQQRQVDAALTRISILLGHPYVKHIIGQTKSKLDFSKIMAEREIIFLKLSAALSADIKKFIGMIVIGELLHHVRRRPTDKRDQFSVFIDEFQNFSTSDDLATFITEARKYKIATTLAHQERLGQLGDNKKMMGATLAAANKVYFQLTIKDAEELAGEFARDPPPEIRLEEQYAISQNPVWDLLKGHNNPKVCELVNKHLRPMKDRISDIYGESEFEKLMRQEYMDDANLLRLDSQIEGVDYRRSNDSARRGALREAGKATMQAKEQTDKLKALSDEGTMIRKAIRLINSLFVYCMEKNYLFNKDLLKFMGEEFSDRLIEIIKSASLPDEDRKTLELYISVCHGGSGKEKMVPFALAKRQGILTEEVKRVEKEIDNEYEEKRASLRKRVWKIYDETIDKELKWNKAVKERSCEIWEQPFKWTSEDIEYIKKSHKWLCEWVISACESEWRIYDIYKNKCTLYEDFEKLIEDIIKTNNGPITKRQFPDIATGFIRNPYTYIKAAKDDLIARGYANIVESIDGLARLCFFLVEPENHIKVKSGQYVEKKVYTRTEADMKAEMVKELANLPRYTAWVKRISESDTTVKNKTRIYSVDERFEYNKDYREFLQKITQNTHDLYCTRRDLIEEETVKRQARWRGCVESPPAEQVPSQEATNDSDKPGKPKPPSTRSPTEKVSDEKERSGSGKPPSTRSSTEKMRNEEPVKPIAANNPKEPEEGSLIYRSNFYLPDDKWTDDSETSTTRLFRQDGYFHVELKAPIIKIVYTETPVTNFKTHVDAQLLKGGNKISYGVCFRYVEDSGKCLFYFISINLDSYALLLCRNYEYEFLLDYRSCQFIRSDNINSLMVQMRGQEITLGINGHILDTVMDNTLTSGCVGIFVNKKEDTPAEVRFRGFRLYSLE